MKKFLVILCLMVLIPALSIASGSPTIKNTVHSNPVLTFAFAEKLPEWNDILARVKLISDEIEGYILLDALQVYIDKSYTTVEWDLARKVTTEDEPFILIIDSEAIVKQEVSITENGEVITDFTDLEIGNYYILFYIRKGA